MPWWGWLLIGLAVCLGVLAAGAVVVMRDPRTRAFAEYAREIGWRATLRGMWRIVRDGRVPWAVRLAPLPLLLYLATPVDLIPDVIPVLGLVDDLVAVGLAAWVMVRFVPPEVLEEHFAIEAEALERR